ncbi:MAG: DUF63 family protein [Candidatus Aenigmatarchaeota archaeon]
MGFFEENFVIPLGKYYTAVNTLVYGIIFALAVFGVYKLLRYLKIIINKDFVIGIIPYVVLGSVLRAMKDALILDYWIFASPIIYMLMFGIATIALLLSIGVAKLAKKKKSRFAQFLSSYHKLWSIIGIVLVLASIIVLSTIGFKNYYESGITLGLTALCGIIVYLLYQANQKFPDNRFLRVFTKENCLLLGVHLFDAATTFTALTFLPYYEQHVVSNFVITYLSPAGQFVLKFIVVIVVLYVLDSQLNEPENIYLRNFLKIAIFILGFAPGLRNFLRTGFGV